MKISVEYKDKKYTVWYGKISAGGSSLKEALDALITKFREELDKLFVR